MLWGTPADHFRRVIVVGLLFTPSLLTAQEPVVPGFNELTVIDPAADETGLPAPIVTPDGKVDIPPTLHVHSYYYSGDREYQGPILQGGPTIVVANHPKSGEKMYIDVTLPPGAPVIAYNKFSITYVYADQRVIVIFPLLAHDSALVKYIHGRGVLREMKEHAVDISKQINAKKKRSRLSSELHELRREASDFVKGAAGVMDRTGGVIVERTRAATRLIPGVQALRSLGDQAEERGAIEEIRQAGLQQAEDATEFIRTIR